MAPVKYTTSAPIYTAHIHTALQHIIRTAFNTLTTWQMIMCFVTLVHHKYFAFFSLFSIVRCRLILDTLRLDGCFSSFQCVYSLVLFHSLSFPFSFFYSISPYAERILKVVITRKIWCDKKNRRNLHGECTQATIQAKRDEKYDRKNETKTK